MRRIAMPGNIKVDINGKETDRTFKEFVIDAVDGCPEVFGRGTKMIRQANKIVGLVEKASGELILENSEYDSLTKALTLGPFRVGPTRQVIRFIDAIEEAEEFDPKP